MKKDFITGIEFSLDEQQEMIQTAIKYKNGTAMPDHSGKGLTLIFANPSLRTRLSFESGMKKMKGEVNVLSASDSWEFEYEDGVVMDQNKQEHIKEAAPILSTYTDLIGLRKSDLMTKKNSAHISDSWEELKEDQAMKQLAKYCEKPIINMESNMFHPCQSLADVMTMTEHFGYVEKKKYVLTWAPHPKPLPLATPHSQLLTPAIFGMDVTLVCPKGFELDSDVISLAEQKAEESGGMVHVSNEQEEAFDGADVVMAKSWASLQFFGKWQEEAAYRKKFTHWMVTEEKMKLTNNALFMHCLPARRNVVVSDAVMDSENSVVIQEAENRMWAQMSLVSKLLS